MEIEEQTSVLKFNKKNLIVSASAGSGKTYILIKLITKLIAEKKVPIKKLLILTFTKNASIEMKERLLKNLKEIENPSDFILRQIDDLSVSNISTIHSYCEHSLKKYANILKLNENFTLADENLSLKLKGEAFFNCLKKWKKENGFFDLFQTFGEKKLFELSNQGESQGGFIDFAEALTSSLGQIEQAYQKDGRISGLPSGLDALDEKTGGLNNSDLIIIAGRPAMGKTALATNIAYNVAEFMSHDKSVDPKSRGVAFFSLEMSADQLASRILSTVTQTPGHKMRTGELDNAEFTRIAAAVRELETIPLYIDDTPGLNINTIRTRARRLKRNKGLGLIVIDYIQLIMGTGSKKTEGNRVQELSEISRGLKILAKELNVPVIALSQLNRGVEQRDDKRPVMSDLRESGSIEQDADIVMFVFRENYYIQNEEPKQRAGETPEHLQNRMEEWQKRIRETANLGEVIIGKQRHGPTGTVKLFWNGEYAQFGNLIKEEYLPAQIG